MAAPPLPPLQELQAPAGWRAIDLISDLHLQASEPATFDAWRRYMAATPADALFILGDLFEAWIGDDAAAEPGFAADCAAVLQAAARRLPVFFMHGNRDFLVGDGLLQSAGATLLSDPAVLGFAGRRWLLTHGDALCLSDAGYQRFRSQVRDAEWQRDFLARPLAERRAIARGLREESTAAQRDAKVPYSDVDEACAADWLRAADASVMIHGHTHRPADHAMASGLARVVLSDWDAGASPPRAEVLRLSAAGARRLPAA